MKSTEFCYWLQGFFELSEPEAERHMGLGIEQVELIKKHLAMVFKHEIDPSYPDGQVLNEIHNKGSKTTLRC
jgi:hypothetical protein